MRPPAPTALPDGWQVVRLGDVIQPRRDLIQPSSDGKARYVGLEHIDSGNARLSRWGTESEVKSSKNKFFAGDILYGKLRPYLDKVVLAEWEGICATDILVFVADRQRALPEFIAYLLHTRAFLNHAISTTSGTNHPRTSWQALQAFAFALPPLPEQRAIARVLATIQRAVEAQDQLIAATRAFKRALMRHLFTYGAVPPADAARVPLKETEIGAVPVGWEVVRLGEVFLPVNKKQREKRIQDNQIYRLLTVRLYAKGLILRSEQIGARIGTKILYETEAGDFVFSKIDARNGAWGFVTEGLAGSLVSGDFPILKLALSRADQSFMEFLLGRPLVWEPLRNLAVGTTNRRRLQVSQLLSIPILLPPLAEQRAIARILTAVDAKIAAEEKRKAALQTLFKTMLHQLMTGQIRVNAAG